MTITIPLRIVSERNQRQSRWALARKTAAQRAHAKMNCNTHPAMQKQRWAVRNGGIVVTLTRIAPRKLDEHDGLRDAFKAIVDGVADSLGVKDNDPRVAWQYRQRSGKPREYAVQIDISPFGEIETAVDEIDEWKDVVP